MTHPRKIGTMQVVDMETGKVVEEKRNAFTILPPAGNVCQVCAVDHNHDQPHDAQSMAYQYRFYSEHGRWPNWSDAMAHCTDEVKALWRAGLIRKYKEMGQPVPEDLLTPKPAGR